MIDLMLITGALGASLAGLLLLSGRWRADVPRARRRALAMALWAVSTALWVARFGAEIGIPLALETAALVAFGFILTRMERRTGRPVRDRAAPPPPRGRWRVPAGIARVLVAGPLGLAAAMGIAVVIATRAPAAEQTRLILAGLIVPTLWAIGIAWIVCRRRLPVQAAAFAAIGIAGFGLTLLAGA